MAKKPTPEIPTSGGSYVVRPDGKLDQVEATQPPPAVHVPQEEPVPAAPAAMPAKNEEI